MIKELASSLECLRYSQKYLNQTSPLHRPEEVVLILMAPDGLLGVSKRAAE